ncbi:MAG: hypothetical protein RLZZ416_628 [Candidatus Parcubacteria bacterium]|jgi:hypothetical protein
MHPEDEGFVGYIFKGFLTVAFSLLVASGISLGSATLYPDSRALIASVDEAGFEAAYSSDASNESPKDAVKDKDSTKTSTEKVSEAKSGKPDVKKEKDPCDSAGKTGSKEHKDCESKQASKLPGKVKWDGGSCIKGPDCEGDLALIRGLMASGGKVEFTSYGGAPVTLENPPNTIGSIQQAVAGSEDYLGGIIAYSYATPDNKDAFAQASAQLAANRGDFDQATVYAQISGYANPAPYPETTGAAIVEYIPELKDQYALTYPPMGPGGVDEYYTYTKTPGSSGSTGFESNVPATQGIPWYQEYWQLLQDTNKLVVGDIEKFYDQGYAPLYSVFTGFSAPLAIAEFGSDLWSNPSVGGFFNGTEPALPDAPANSTDIQHELNVYADAGTGAVCPDTGCPSGIRQSLFNDIDMQLAAYGEPLPAQKSGEALTAEMKGLTPGEPSPWKPEPGGPSTPPPTVIARPEGMSDEDWNARREEVKRKAGEFSGSDLPATFCGVSSCSIFRGEDYGLTGKGSAYLEAKGYGYWYLGTGEGAAGDSYTKWLESLDSPFYRGQNPDSGVSIARELGSALQEDYDRQGMGALTLEELRAAWNRERALSITQGVRYSPSTPLEVIPVEVIPETELPVPEFKPEETPKYAETLPEVEVKPKELPEPQVVPQEQPKEQPQEQPKLAEVPPRPAEQPQDKTKIAEAKPSEPPQSAPAPTKEKNAAEPTPEKEKPAKGTTPEKQPTPSPAKLSSGEAPKARGGEGGDAGATGQSGQGGGGQSYPSSPASGVPFPSFSWSPTSPQAQGIAAAFAPQPLLAYTPNIIKGSVPTVPDAESAVPSTICLPASASAQERQAHLSLPTCPTTNSPGSSETARQGDKIAQAQSVTPTDSKNRQGTSGGTITSPDLKPTRAPSTIEGEAQARGEAAKGKGTGVSDLTQPEKPTATPPSKTTAATPPDANTPSLPTQLQGQPLNTQAPRVPGAEGLSQANAQKNDEQRTTLQKLADIFAKVWDAFKKEFAGSAQAAPLEQQPLGINTASFTNSARSSLFGQCGWGPYAGCRYVWRDAGDNGKNALPGAPQTEPGIALYNWATLGQYFLVRLPNGQRRVVRQVDIGPSPWTGKGIDINAPLAESAGYTPSGNTVYPTGQQVSWRLLGPLTREKAAEYNKLLTNGNDIFPSLVASMQSSRCPKGGCKGDPPPPELKEKLAKARVPGLKAVPMPRAAGAGAGALAGKPLSYLIGGGGGGDTRGRVVETQFFGSKSQCGNADACIGYVNMFTQGQTAGKYGPYLPRTGTGNQYKEDRPDPRGPGFKQNLQGQFTHYKNQNIPYVEMDNQDGYSLEANKEAMDLAQQNGLGVAVKNPGLNGLMPLAQHPAAVAIICERGGCPNPAGMKDYLNKIGKPNMPVWYVGFGGGLSDLQNIANQINGNQNYSNMGATFSSGCEYCNVRDYATPKGSGAPVEGTPEVPAPNGPYMVDPQTGTAFECTLGDKSACEQAFRKQAALSRGCANGTMPCDAQWKTFTAKRKDGEAAKTATPPRSAEPRLYGWGGPGSGVTTTMHPIVRKAMEEATKDLPPGWHARVNGCAGDRNGSGSYHEQRGTYQGGTYALACDVQLHDAQGKPLSWLKTPSSYEPYRIFMQNVKHYQDQLFPEFKSRGNWGGYFGSGVTRDWMHYDLGPTNYGKAGSWETGMFPSHAGGLDPAQLAKGGMGDRASYQPQMIGGGTINPLVMHDITDEDGNAVGTLPLPEGSIGPDNKVDLLVDPEGKPIINPDTKAPLPATNDTLPKGAPNPQKPDEYLFEDNRPTEPSPSTPGGPGYPGGPGASPSGQNGMQGNSAGADGMGSQGGQPPPPRPPQQAFPASNTGTPNRYDIVSCTISASPTTVSPNAATTLTWSSVNAVSAIMSGFGSVPLSGSMTQNPAVTTTYTLTVYGAAGSSSPTSCSVGVSVSPSATSAPAPDGRATSTPKTGKPPRIILIANPKTVKRGEKSQLGWITTGMDSCVISSPAFPRFTADNAGKTNLNGAITTPALASPTTFILACTTIDGPSKAASTTVGIQ